MLKTINLLIIFFTLINIIYAQNVFVSPTGNDSNSGTIDQPLGTITEAINKIQPGDTIFVRSGIYSYSTNIGISKSGSESNFICLFAYPGERPLLDFSSQSFGTKGISLKANYWHIKGFDITGAGDNGMEISAGSNNIIEFCSFYENQDTGLQLSNGASNNKIINCDSYYNADPPDYGDADGFAPKLTVGSGNYFYGCRSWGNCDDGWDGYMRGANDVTTTLENCWTFANGYLKDGTDPGPKANGNGFKMGGGDNSNSQHLMHHFILKNCLSFDNKVKGFDQNNNDGSMTLLNCTGFGNKTANYRITRQVNAGQTVTVENCISFEGNVDLGSFVVQQTNSWLSPFNVKAEDFISVDTTGVRGPRKSDGSLPDVKFMHLAEGSDLINAGTNIGLPYNGNAPDLGAFESDITNVVNENNENIPSGFSLMQNYPNPFNPSTTIRFQILVGDALSSAEVHVTLKVYDILGREVATLVDGYKNPGTYETIFNGQLTNAKGQLSNGVYFYTLQVRDSFPDKSGSEFQETKKMLLLK